MPVQYLYETIGNQIEKKTVFEKRIVAAHLRGMRPTPSTKKDTLMLREKIKL